MKKLFLLILPAFLFACNSSTGKSPEEEISTTSVDTVKAKEAVDRVLEDWHREAAEANFENYFALMAGDGIFIGTDATENWGISEFKAFSKPYFDKGTAWNFSTLQRNIYISRGGEIAWFDELLNTWMGICRGSGVVTKENGKWRIKHYVLSVTVPNESINEVVAAKKDRDSTLISNFQ